MIKTTLNSEIFDSLYKVIKAKKGGDLSVSYTAHLFNEGKEHICKKFGEESVEVIVAALSQKKQDVIYESSDVIFHLFVLWAEMGIELKDVMDELEKRSKFSGIDEKQKRIKK
jgi:phosphoribosyl-ATP pyrophosphohydrolase